ncbi:MAG: pirin family protein [bacterium]
MTPTIHKADSRGLADHGWLKSRHTFSFASYYDDKRMGFGVLRVLNDDVVAPGRGFGTHPHENMEIISIPLHGQLRHKDSEGNETVIKNGEVQIMSAGTGVLHSEYNHSDTDAVNFLQIWVLPKKQNIHPRYDQRRFDPEGRQDQFQLAVSPLGTDDAGIKINQDAYFSLVDLSQGRKISYDRYRAGNLVYLFVMDGSLEVNGEQLAPRDAIGLTDPVSIGIQATSKASVLVMEVPGGKTP